MRAWCLLFVAACAPQPFSDCERPRDLTSLDAAFARYSKLSQVCVLKRQGGALISPEDGLPYTLTTPLFSDYTDKARVILLPKGERMGYSADAVLDFPVGTIITKTFSENGRPIETRLLVRGPEGWLALPYVWKGDDAELSVGGAAKSFSITRGDGREVEARYNVPNANQCGECHQETRPIGPTARALNRDGQLQAWADAGRLSGFSGEAAALARFDDASAPLEARARAWLEMNCAHCHQPGGSADTTGLDLRAAQSAPRAYGVCKTPVAAGQGSGGRRYDIVPGFPDSSILVYRIESVAANEMMPELGRSLVHEEGVALVRAWITSLGDPSLSDATGEAGCR